MQGLPGAGVQEVLLALGVALMLSSLCVGAYAARAYLRDDVRGARAELDRRRGPEGRAAPGQASRRARVARAGMRRASAREPGAGAGRGAPPPVRAPSTPPPPPPAPPTALPTMAGSPILAPFPHGCASSPTLDLRRPLAPGPPGGAAPQGELPGGAACPGGAARQGEGRQGRGAGEAPGRECGEPRGDGGAEGRAPAAEGGAERGGPAVSSMGEASELEGVKP
jgi:hypothetical protein